MLFDASLCLLANEEWLNYNDGSGNGILIYDMRCDFLLDPLQ